MDQGGGDDLMGDEDEDRMRKMNLDDRMLENDDDSDRRRQSLRLSLSRDDSARGDAGISFGDEDSLTAAAPPAEANRKSVEPLDGTAKNNNKRKWTDDKKKKRRRRGRKADLDEGHTELTNEHIRSMLADTSRVVASDGGIHPATWVPENETRRHGGRKNLFRSNRQLLSSHLSYEQRLCRPALSDDGQLVPKLLNLWARNCGPVGGQSLDYEMVADVVGEQQGAESNPPVEGEPDEEEEEGSVEMTRAGGGGGDSMEEEDHPQGRVENEIPQADDDGFPETDGGDNPFDGDNGGVGIDPSGFPDDNVAMADYSKFENTRCLFWNPRHQF